MNGERAEAYLRLLAEAEVRRVTTLPDGSAVRQWQAPRVMLAAQALCAAGAIDDGAAAQVRSEFDLALAVRQLSRPGISPGVRLDSLLMLVQRAHTAPGSKIRPATVAAPRRVVPLGQVIPGSFRGGGDLLLLAYVQTPAGARFTTAIAMAGPAGIGSGTMEPGRPPQPHRALPARPLTAVDDQGTSYQFLLIGGFRTAVLELVPDPPHAIRWLDLLTASGEPAIRIDLDPPDPQPNSQRPPLEVTVTRTATSPGEILLDGIAARILILLAGSPPGTTARPPAASNDQRAFFSDGPGNIAAALSAAGALPLASPVPGQLAGLCDRVGIPDHGITAPPAADLPQPWQGMLNSYHRQPHPPPAHGSWAAFVARLPELDGVQLTVLGLNHGEPSTFVHLLASGVTPDDDWSYTRGVRSLPALWIRDSNGDWHATRTRGLTPWKDTTTMMMWLEIFPPLEAGAAWIDVLAVAPSAQVRARLPLCWQSRGWQSRGWQ
jgi:hypothetical protein